LNRAFVAVGVALVVILGVVGYLLLRDGEAPPPPVNAESETAPAAVAPAEPEPAPTEATPEGETAETSGSLPVSEPRAQALVQPGPQPEPQAQPESTEQPGTESESLAALPQPAAEPETGAQPQAAPETAPQAAPPILPSFDVVRMERNGEAVLAGRAAPGAEIIVRANGREVGRAVANGRGEWVLVPGAPLQPGSYELTLEAHGADGMTLLADNVVVLAVPQPQVAAAQEAPAAGGAEVAAASGSGEAVAAANTASPAAETTGQKPVSVTQPLAVLLPRDGEGISRILQQPETADGGLAEGALVLQTIDYDADGTARFGGQAPQGAKLIVYLDEAAIGNDVVGEDGRWSVVLNQSVAPGLHRLRVDQVGQSGQVLARVETPFSRAESVVTLPEEVAVVVQPGNSLWRIARRIYGEGVQYTVIYQANQQQIRDPDLIYPGQIFVVPTDN